MHAKAVRWRQYVIPAPNVVQIALGWLLNALFNGRTGIRNAHSDCVDQRLDMSPHSKLQHIFGVPDWADLKVAIVKAYFKAKRTLFTSWSAT